MSKVVLGDYKDDDVLFLQNENCYCIVSEGSGMHQKLNKEGIDFAYYCGSSDGAHEVRDIFVKFKFGGAKCVITLDEQDFETVSKDIDIQN